MLDHGNAAEWMQVIIASIGIVLAVRAVRRAYSNLRAAQAKGVNGRTAFWGVARVRQEVVLLLLHTLVFWLPGVVSLFLEPGRDEALSAQGFVRLMALMMGTLISSVFSLLNDWDHQVLEDYEEKQMTRPPDDATPSV